MPNENKQEKLVIDKIIHHIYSDTEIAYNEDILKKRVIAFVDHLIGDMFSKHIPMGAIEMLVELAHLRTQIPYKH